MKLKRDWQQGKQSNFHACCIVYYLIRSAIMDAVCKVSYPLYHWIFISRLRCHTIDNEEEELGQSHILCPIHRIVYLFKKIRYWHCRDCHEYILRRPHMPKCLNCGSPRLEPYKKKHLKEVKVVCKLF